MINDKFLKFQKSQKGVGLLVVVITISLVLIIVMAISLLMVTELKIAGRVEDSASAYYAGEAGVEDGLLQYKGGTTSSPEQTFNLSNGATYTLTITEDPPASGKIKIKSIGKQKGVLREIDREAITPPSP